ncbi:formate dehydrogenase subunit delta [Streptomyces sp. NPDC050095]|uniref:formate dehydrogenase subunit delta n=1 Tax=unclassified Streptomyces TaxID=2593676 RepID=UPI003436DD4A
MSSTVPAECRMANDIARNHAHVPAAEAAEAIAGHLTKFWDPRMRERLFGYVDAYVDEGDGELDPLVVAARKLMR